MLRMIMSTRNDFTALVLRVTLGVGMFPHGAQKVLGMFGGQGIAATVAGFETGLGIPPALAYLALAAEFLGAIGLIVGFLGRAAALGIGTVMVVAVMKVHRVHGFFMNWSGAQGGEGYEYHLLAIGIAVAILMKGSGALSVDRAVTWGADSNG